jgi:hypothetical protein
VSVFDEVTAERRRQDDKWGEQNHPDGTGGRGRRSSASLAKLACEAAVEAKRLTWRHVLVEEVAEVFAENDQAKLRAELVQVAAVAVAWIEAIDRRERK